MVYTSVGGYGVTYHSYVAREFRNRKETSKGKDVRLLRPGHTNSKNSGIFDRDTNCFTCFSSSTSFEVNKGYSPANLYIELVCDGDVVRAFKELTEMIEK